MAGKADAIGKPAGELPFRVEPLEDVHPIGYVCLAVEAFQHLTATGQEIALSPVWARLEAVGQGVLVAPSEGVCAERAAKHRQLDHACLAGLHGKQAG